MFGGHDWVNPRLIFSRLSGAILLLIPNSGDKEKGTGKDINKIITLLEEEKNENPWMLKISPELWNIR